MHLKRIAAALAVALGACRGGGAGSTDPDPTAGPGDMEGGDVTVSTSTRRLSAYELATTLEVLTGVAPAAMQRLPPESTEYGFDRVVDGQTISRPHLDAYLAIADGVVDELLGQQRLDDLAGACRDEIVPPPVASERIEVSGSGLTGDPDWAFSTSASDPTVLTSQYAENPTVSIAHSFPAPGEYRVVLSARSNDRVDSIQVHIDGTRVATAADKKGRFEISATTHVDETGVKPVEFRLRTEPENSNLVVDFYDLTIEGPLDAGGAAFDGERDACATALIDSFAPLAFRRPLQDAERERLAGLYAAGAEEGGFVVGLRMVFQAILASPNFLYLVERGEPVSGRAGVFQLGPWELAARLSYALCEGPPDAALREAAADGSLDDDAVLEAHARRLLESPCGHDTVRRFYLNWLHLDRLPHLNRDPEAFPEWNDAVRDGLVAEANTFIDELVWNERASFQTLMTTGKSWPDPRSADLHGGERAGALTQPAVLAATGTFSGTSPVERGVFVLEQLMCEELDPPPPSNEIVPPPPDPNLTTRQRWAAHSDEPQCAACHELMDPPGFALENFDGIGRYRTEENGAKIDARGGLLPLDLDDGSIDGGAALARAIGKSERAADCFAQQWMRFALGRMPVDADAATHEELGEAARSESMVDVLLSIATSESFRYRYEGEDR